MFYFAYHPKTRPTGRRLADALGIVHRGTLVGRGKKQVAKPDFLVRWGNARFPELDGASRVVNKAQAILLAGDKLRAIEQLGRSDVRTPVASRVCPGSGVILARRRRGFGGTDIQVCSHDPCVGAEWYSTYIPTNREYRLHVVGDKVVRVQRKYLERPDERVSEYVKNHKNGYAFKQPSRRLNSSRLDAAVKAVQSLGLDFGAVDLVVGEDKLEYVLEVNTAPACSPKTLNAYSTALADLVRERSGDDYILHPSVEVEKVLANSDNFS